MKSTAPERATGLPSYGDVFDIARHDRGFLMSIEGFDGSGKSTQIDALAERFSRLGHSVVKTRQPTTWYREQEMVRSFHAHGGTPALAKVLALLSAADRQRHIQEVVAPALEVGCVVISDRYVCSTFAVFGHRGVDDNFLITINRPVLRPDVAAFLEVPVATLIERLIARDGADLKFEERSPERISSILAYWSQLRGIVDFVDGARSPPEITDTLWRMVPLKWRSPPTPGVSS